MQAHSILNQQKMTNFKINFTAEHKTKLEKLFLSLSFTGHMLSGKFGANSLSPYDLLHNASVSTLRSLHSQLKNEIAKTEADEDEWTTSSYQQQQLSLKKKWKEFIHLVIGWKKAEQEKADNRAAVKNMKAKLAELKESTKTPEEQIKELEDSIAAMSSEETE